MSGAYSTLSKPTIILHWTVALIMIGEIGVGLYMKTFELIPIYPWHKAIGVLAMVIILARVVWRLKKGWPKPVSDYQKHEQFLSKIIHWVLILGTLIMPISGLMLSGAGGYGVYVFGFELIPDNIQTEPTFKVIPYNATIAGLGHWLHEIVGYALIAAITLHIVGALKHHIIDRDSTIRRMLGQQAT